MTLVTAGATHYRYRRCDDTIEPDTLVLMEPGEVHASTKAEAPGNFCAFFFPAELFAGGDLVRTATQLPHFARRMTKQPDLVAAFREALRMLRTGDPGLAQQLRFAMDRLLASTTEGGSPPPRRDVRMQRAARTLRDWYEDDPWAKPAAETIAAEVGVTISKLGHDFKHEFGMPPLEYWEQVRLAKMRRLFVTGPQPGLRSSEDVGGVLGYCDKSHFHRRVFDRYGITPYQFGLGVHPKWMRPSTTLQ